MRRGTTPTLRVTVDADITEMDVYLALRAGRVLIVKETDALDMSLGEDGKTTVLCPLTQADTLKMAAGTNCEVQVRAIEGDGAVAIATTIGSVPVERILQDGVLGGA